MAAVENLPFDFWMQDENGCFVVQNESSIQTWGELTGKKLPETHLEPEIQAVWDRNIQKALRGEVVRMEVTYPGHEQLGTFYSITAPVMDEDTPSGILGINIGISMIKQRERELQALVTMAGALRSVKSQAEMREITLVQVMDLLHVDGASLISMDFSNREVFIELGWGSWAHFTGRKAASEGKIIERILGSGEIYWNNNFQAESDLAFPEMKENMISAACVPLIAEHTTIGALAIGSLFPLSENQVKLLQAMVDISGNAIYRAMVNEQKEHHLQRLTILRAIDSAISTSLDSRLTLNILLNQVTNQLKLDAAAIYLIDNYDRSLSYSAGRGLRSINVNPAHFELGEGLPGRVAAERRIQIIPDLHALAEIPANLVDIPAGEKITYIGLPLISKGDVKGVLELYSRTPIPSNPDWIDFLKAISTQAAIAIDNAELVNQLQRSNTDLKLAYDATIEGWSRALELRDRETEGHSRRVANLTVQLCRSMGMLDEALENIRRGVLLHDIGKMAIPDRVLLKPGPLTADEWEIMKKHPQYAYELLSSIPYLSASMDIPFSHHERWDGKGYPRGLKGRNIPLAARIFAIVDVWDALSSDRPYRSAWSVEHIRSYLIGQAGKRFDPQVVSVFIEKFLEKNIIHQQM
jgi:putative nucleotidyltransferase with HDIG domain